MHRSVRLRLQNRQKSPIMGPDGEVKGWTKGSGGRPTEAEYKLHDLHDSAVEKLTHYFETLKRSEAMPRFGFEATGGASAASA